MILKKTIFAILAITNIVLLRSDNKLDPNDQQEVILTLDEIRQYQGNLKFGGLSNTGLKKIIECVNNFDRCDHFGLLEAMDQNHPNYKKHINARQKHFAGIKPDEKQILEFHYKDLVTEDFYNEVINSKEAPPEAIFINNPFFAYLYCEGFLAAKRATAK